MPNTQWTVQTVKCAGIQKKETTIALDWNIIPYYDISQVFTRGLPFHNRHLVTAHTVKGHVNSYLKPVCLKCSISGLLGAPPVIATGDAAVCPGARGPVSPLFSLLPSSFLHCSRTVSYRQSPIIPFYRSPLHSQSHFGSALDRCLPKPFFPSFWPLCLLSNHWQINVPKT